MRFLPIAAVSAGLLFSTTAAHAVTLNADADAYVRGGSQGGAMNGTVTELVAAMLPRLSQWEFQDIRSVRFAHRQRHRIEHSVLYHLIVFLSTRQSHPLPDHSIWLE